MARIPWITEKSVGECRAQCGMCAHGDANQMLKRYQPLNEFCVDLGAIGLESPSIKTAI